MDRPVKDIALKPRRTLREHRVNIYPGEYVVIGRRSGFRDIRKEIAITGEAQTLAVRIEAVEPIN